MTPWGEYSECSKTCGGGSQYRTRDVSCTAKNGGQKCPEERKQTRSCNTQGCPVDCKQGL